MSTDCKTTENSEEVVCSEERRVELMGVNLQTDPYLIESEEEDDGLFGDAVAAADKRSASAIEEAGAPDAADNPNAETAETRFLPSP